MEFEKISTKKFYTIKGSGRSNFYKITSVDKVEKKVYLAGVNCTDLGWYLEVDKLRVFSDRSIAEYVEYIKGILVEIDRKAKYKKKL